MTGLEDARLGVMTGLYSSYVIIPSDFSRTVYSINTQPVVSRLSFAVSNELSAEKREQAVYNIEALRENLNNSLTEVYLSSVMKEFSMVELPEMIQVENTVAELDLTKQYEDSGNLLTVLGRVIRVLWKKGRMTSA